MIRHRLFAIEPIGNLSYLHAVILEISKQYFIIIIDIYELLILFSIITPCLNKNTRTYIPIYIYIYIYIYIQVDPKKTQIAWQLLSVKKSSETLH